MSDCITLCKGCHAQAHGITPPSSGWHLLAVENLLHPEGTCERPGCGHAIQYEHHIYHPAWGHMIVGSQCVEYLTDDDVNFVHRLRKYSEKVSKYIHKECKPFMDDNDDILFYYITIGSQKHRVEIRINGENEYQYQLFKKRKSPLYTELYGPPTTHDPSRPFLVMGKSFIQVKEMAVTHLLNKIQDDPLDKKVYAELFRALQ
ncbi:hypothetical protein [Marinigracilibium pacificum]|uniref:Uncharacterized protein n=1 Tax=Marinigracilibium pacificum TaxID=2729599 RepID=A0A848J4Z1_9BACT|nr:hypothetical protein [Marinigracilibium pacificum]NMM50338.1 hypothetical protein [Marinigracilibium pacificum]